MSSLLVRHADVLVTMDEHRREIPDGGLFAEDGWIGQVGPTNELPAEADEVLDLRGHVVIPGLVNTHHHLYQTLTRAVPGVQDVPLFDWLTNLYPIWGRMRPEDVTVSTAVGLSELALSGCTTAFDHHYLWPNASAIDHQVEAARRVGIRFHASRGSMSLGRSHGGLPPDDVVESDERILEETRRAVETFHDPSAGAMVRIVVSPCSPFSVTPELMRASADLARSMGVRLHTHLAETVDEDAYCLQHFGSRPIPYAERLGWLGEDVWLAHAVHVRPEEARLLAQSGTGVAHCPTSNMRLASGIAPLLTYLSEGVEVGLGVDGSASNDSSHLLAEARQAMLLARLAVSPGVGGGGPLLPARTALELATLGGASVLGRDDVGALAAGKAADLAAIRLDRLELAGGLHDPVAALVFCAPPWVDQLVVHGRQVVRDGELLTVDVASLVAAQNQAARRLVEAS